MGWWPYLGYFRLRKSQFCLRDPCATLKRKEIQWNSIGIKRKSMECNGNQWKNRYFYKLAWPPWARNTIKSMKNHDFQCVHGTPKARDIRKSLKNQWKSMKINGNPMKLGMTARDLFLMQNPKFEKNCETWMGKFHKLLAPAAKMKICKKKNYNLLSFVYTNN